MSDQPSTEVNVEGDNAEVEVNPQTGTPEQVTPEEDTPQGDE